MSVAFELIFKSTMLGVEIMSILECSFPNESLISNELKSADFHDSYQLLSLENDLDPLDIYLLMVSNTPQWINTLLSLRNKVVNVFGLIDVGRLGEINYAQLTNKNNLIGQKLDLFEIENFNKNEMVLILNDKHLDIKISILKKVNSSKFDVIVSTIVHFHNGFGKIYMALISPFHKIVVKRLMKNIKAVV